MIYLYKCMRTCSIIFHPCQDSNLRDLFAKIAGFREQWNSWDQSWKKGDAEVKNDDGDDYTNRSPSSASMSPPATSTPVSAKAVPPQAESHEVNDDIKALLKGDTEMTPEQEKELALMLNQIVQLESSLPKSAPKLACFKETMSSKVSFWHPAQVLFPIASPSA